MDGAGEMALQRLVQAAQIADPNEADLEWRRLASALVPNGHSGPEDGPEDGPKDRNENGKEVAAERVLFDLTRIPCDTELAGLMPPDLAIALSAVPHSRVAGRLVVATSRMDLAPELRRHFPGERVLVAEARPDHIVDAIFMLYGAPLARAAETRAPQEDSARVWTGHQLSLRLALPLMLLALGGLMAPQATGLALFALAIGVFGINMGVKLAATATALRSRRPLPAPRAIPLFREPVITIMVPLFKERDVARHILARIDQLDYPRDKLDVIFILEASDDTTRRALDDCALPQWARAITVPPGSPQTKPRALNYALPFARGTIIGIYDAEDAPEKDQLARVAARFALSPPDVACLQGQLDYYNASHNWVSRCFTIEYATWFRLLLPGVARMGWVVPLGGTTLFIKREALIQVGAWDAHNVTEDAELGIRLHRHGFRTELLDTTTFEEANSAIWPWVRQRTRWLKGYAITWATVMRRPGKLLRDLGLWKFLGLQVQIAGTVLGFVMAPLLWSMVLIPTPLIHPIEPYLTPVLSSALVAGFALSAVLTLAINWLGCTAPHLRHLKVRLPIMLLYYPLASISATWALIELAIRPFYWAKTAHGAFGGADHETNHEAAGAVQGVSDPIAPASALSRTSNATDR